MRIVYILIIFAGFLASCAPSTKVVKITKDTHEKPFSYQDGFLNGCSSGFQQKGMTGYLYFKDLLRYQNDDDYRIGWLAGYKKCS